LDLIGLKFRSRKILDFSVIESATAGACLLQPAMNRIPGNCFDSSDRRLVQSIYTQSSNFIKRGATMLKPIIRCANGRGERLPTSVALVAAAVPPLSFVETVASHVTSSIFPEEGQSPFGQLRLFMVGGPCR
jgi:hypothetical protein